MLMWRYILAWVPMVLIAIANGVVRQAWYGKYMSELRAHQLSTAIGALLLGIYIWAVVRNWTPDSSLQAIWIGLMWLGLTAAFEFVFGHYVAGQSWSRLFQDYNILAGRVWAILLLWVVLAPYVFYRLQK
jgi:hypothetical protein